MVHTPLTVVVQQDQGKRRVERMKKATGEVCAEEHVRTILAVKERVAEHGQAGHGGLLVAEPSVDE